MEPITAITIYITMSIIGFGMIYYKHETHTKNVYKNIESSS